MADLKISQLPSGTPIDTDLCVYVDTVNNVTKSTPKSSLKGDTGNGIASISLISTVGLVKTYRITYTDATTFDFTTTDGIDGIDGTNGTNGTNGNGIVSITLTSGDHSAGTTDIYTILFTDTTTTTFSVYNGADGTGTGDLFSTNNLSDLASIPTAKVNLGLNNVDNTSDADKPISTATQTALDGKSATTHNHTGVYEPVFTKGTAFNKNFGTAAGDVMAGETPVIVDNGNQTINGELTATKFIGDGSALTGIIAPPTPSTKSTFVAGEDITSGDAISYYSYHPIVLVVDQNSGDNSTDLVVELLYGYSTSIAYQRETFTITSSITDLKLTLSLQKTGNPDGNTVVGIYRTSDDVLVTSEATIPNDNITTSYLDYTFNLSGTLTLTTSEAYYIRASTDGTLSSSNYMRWENASNDTAYTGGTGSYGSDVPEWTANNLDHTFKIEYLLPLVGGYYKTDASNSAKINFVGFATETKLTGENIIVDTAGVNSNQTGLTSGSDYFLQDTAGAIGTTPGTNEVKVGRATDTTDILIDTSTGLVKTYFNIAGSFTNTTASTITIIHNLGYIPERITGSLYHTSDQLGNGTYINGNQTWAGVYTTYPASGTGYLANTNASNNSSNEYIKITAIDEVTLTLETKVNNSGTCYYTLAIQG